jgi:plastocyanin
MRKFGIAVVGVLIVVGFVGISPAGAKSSNPVSVSGKVNVKGKKDISGKTSASIELEQDDYYFEPTFVKVSPGEKVTVELKNEGDTTHTFTSDSLNVDQQVSAGKSKKVTVTIPSSGNAFQFHCDFHESMGMQGAFYTKAGGKAT